MTTIFQHKNASRSIGKKDSAAWATEEFDFIYGVRRPSIIHILKKRADMESMGLRGLKFNRHRLVRAISGGGDKSLLWDAGPESYGQPHRIILCAKS